MYMVENFTEVKKAFLQDTVSVVIMEEVPPEIIIKWDQTGIKLVPCWSWTTEKRGAKRVQLLGAHDK